MIDEQPMAELPRKYVMLRSGMRAAGLSQLLPFTPHSISSAECVQLEQDTKPVRSGSYHRQNSKYGFNMHYKDIDFILSLACYIL